MDKNEFEQMQPFGYAVDVKRAKHFISASCDGERCSNCHAPATHKVGEEIMHDDPCQVRHEFTAYVCCECFQNLFGDAVLCDNPD